MISVVRRIKCLLRNSLSFNTTIKNHWSRFLKIHTSNKMKYLYRYLLSLLLPILLWTNANAVTYRYPSAITTFNGALNYCTNRAAQPMVLTFSTVTCGAGGNANVNITVTWYSNVVNSNIGGIAVQTVNSNAGTTTYRYVPVTSSVGTLYYYAKVSWNAIGCVAADSLKTVTQAITINSCAPSADMPDPPSNLITVPAGSLVIPMDNPHQNLYRGFPFNIKAYGLVDSLLLDDIPVYWVIKSGKIKDSSDFNAVASRVYPTALAANMEYFHAGEFIIDTAWLNKPYYPGELSALQIIVPFAQKWKVAVYKLSNNTTVDVRYTLHQRPKIACFNNGTHQQISIKLLDSAQMSNYVAISAGVFTGLADCYTFCNEMHWSGATLADSPTMAPVWAFVQEGGNFLAQCAGENTYENLMQVPRHFHTTNGTNGYFPATLPKNTYTNPDMAFAQFQGNIAPRGGTVSDWSLAPGSSFDTETYNCVYSVTRDTIIAAARHYGNPDSLGGNAFYIGGHDYMTGTFNDADVDSMGDINFINGCRLFLNACLIPAHRPTPIPLQAGNNTTICKGDSAQLGGNPTGPPSPPAVYTWSPSAGLNNPNSPNPKASPSVTTTYTVFVNSGGCPYLPSEVTVTVVPIPATPTPSSNSPVCTGSTLNLTTAAVPGATYSWTGPNGFISALQNPSIPGVVLADAGTYSLTVSVSGCTSPTGTVVVTVNPTPSTPTPSSNSPLCAGSTLNLSTPAVGGATYSWTGPNGFTSALQNPSISNAPVADSGTYTVTVTVGGCSSAAGTVHVVINPVPATPTPTSNSPVCAGSTLNLFTTAVAGATYSWTGPNGFISALQNPTISNAQPVNSGTYSLTVTVAGCTSAVGTVGVTVNPIPATPTPTSNSPICAGSTLNLFTPAVAGATYSWTGPNGFISSAQNPTISNAQVINSGTYSVSVIVGGCSSGIGTVSVTVNPTPATPTATSNSPICANSTLDLFTPAVGGATYSWTGPNGFTSSAQNPTIPNAQINASGIYSVTVTVAGCTSAAGTVSVTVNPTPATPSPTSNSPICAGSTLNLFTTAVAGATYNWTGPNGFISALQNPSISNAQVINSGTYSLTVTVAGCTSAVGTVSVTVSPEPATPTPTSNSPICANSTLNLFTPAVGGATYSWTGPNGFISSAQNPTIVNAQTNASGIYSVTVTVAGCTSATGTVSVTVNPTPATPTATSNSPVCAGSTLDLFTPAVGGATYSWTGPNGFISSAQNPTISNAQVINSGTYSVTVTVAGCTSPAGTVAVVVNNPPGAPVPTSNSPVCTGNTLNLFTALVVNATYSWTGPNGFISALQNPSISNVTMAAAGTYTVVVSVPGCGTGSGTVSVVINPTPATPTATSNSPICANSTLNLFTPAVGGATYSWTGPNGFISSAQNPSIVNAQTNATGTYSVTVTVGGCTSAPGTVAVVVNPTPAAPSPTSNSPICVGSTLNLFTPAVGGATYSWTGPNGFISSAQNPSISNAQVVNSGTYSVTVTVAGCTSPEGVVTVTVTPKPATPSPTSNSPLCANDTLKLFTALVPGATYSWTGPNGFISALQNPDIPNAQLINSGTYSLTVTVSGCSSAIGTVSVTINPSPATPAPTSNSPICRGSTLNLFTPAVGGAIYDWSGPNAFSSALQNPSISNAQVVNAGTYSVTVTVSGCTSLPGTVQVIIDTPAVVNAGVNQTVCANNDSVHLNGSSSTGSGKWTTGGTGVFVPNDTTLNAIYIPSNADTAAHSVILTLTSAHNGACAPVSSNITITITPAPTAEAGNNVSVCANNPNVALHGVFSVATGAIWSTTGTGTFSPNNVNMNATYIPSPADTTAGSVKIILTTTGNGLCKAVTDTMTITFTGSPYVEAGRDTVLCLSSPDYQLNGSSSTGKGKWTTLGSGTFTPSDSALNATYNPSNADTTAKIVKLILTSTHNGGCNPVADTVILTFRSIPKDSAGTNQTVCANNDIVSLHATSSTGRGKWTTGGSGTFSPNDTTLNAQYIPSNADTAAHSVILTFSAVGGCVPVPKSIVITITPAPSVEAGVNQSICKNNILIANLNGSIGGGFSKGVWTTLGSGTFSPNDSTLNATYTPSNADTAAGQVKLILTSTHNGSCLPVSDTVIIFYTTPPVANAGGNLTGCANDSIQLNGVITGGGGKGVWTTPNGSGTFVPNDSALHGWYIPSNADTAVVNVKLILTSVDNGGCLASKDSIIIHVLPDPIVDAGTNQTICKNNDTVTISGSILHATGGKWTTSGCGTFLPNDSTLNARYVPCSADTAAGTVTLTLTSTGNGFCKAVNKSIVITFSQSPVMSVTSPVFICTGSLTAQLNATISGGSTTGLWTTLGSGTFSPSDTTLNAIYNLSNADTAAKIVKLVLTSTHNGNCTSVTDTVVIKITSIPIVNAGPDTITVCANNANIALNGTVTGGGGTGVWSTSGSGTFSPKDTALNAIYNSSSGDTAAHSVLLILTATNSCKPVSDTIHVLYSPAPVITPGPNQTICAGSVVQLNAAITIAGGAKWSTTGDGTFTPNDSALNATYIPGTADTATGSVWLRLITTNNGLCNPVLDSVLITIDSKPAANFMSSRACANSTVTFTDLSTVSRGSITGWWWNFSNGSSLNKDTADVFASPGVQNIIHAVTTSAGCTDTIRLSIYVNPVPDAKFSVTPACPDSAQFTDASTITPPPGTITGWQWILGDGDTLTGAPHFDHGYTTAGIYTVTLTVTTDSGCSASYSDTVSVFKCPNEGAVINPPAVPTGFTPGANVNNILYVRGGPFSQLDFRVFNEWGNQIFETENASIGWDGTFKGQKQPEGVYVWTLVATTTDGRTWKMTGDITILK